MSTAGTQITREDVLVALDRVYDPELDEPITSLGFVRHCAVMDAEIDVVLRLPTPQCAPNFAFMMASDARREIESETGSSEVTVRIDDHYTGEEINGAVSRGLQFGAAFPGETSESSDELQSLRSLFRRKALIARQAAICEALLDSGSNIDDLVKMTVAELPLSSEAVRSLELRVELGVGCEPGSPALVSPAGEALTAAEFPRWLRMARLVRTGLEVNGGICRSLLQGREGGALVAGGTA
jgi:metal-sulfur cluster biosynthetic enzyme